MGVTTIEDPGLLAAARAGDERAFRLLVEPYRRALEAHCYRMLGSPHEAEDLVQETLLRAWRSLDRFERRASVRTWLYRIATNACLDQIERRPRQIEPVLPYPDERLEEEAAAGVVDPAARYALRESVELAFLTVIRRLPGRQRTVLILRDVLGWTAPEVAELLDSTVASVNSALQRARATLEDAPPATAAPPPGASAQGALLARYVAAWEGNDIDGLVALLREDALLHMPPGPDIHGIAEAGPFFQARVDEGTTRLLTLTPTRANRQPAILLHRGTTPYGVLVFTVDGDAVARIDMFRDGESPALFDRTQERLRVLPEETQRR